MAVTSIWPITGNPNGVIEYAINPEKTSADSREETAALHAIDKVMEYTADDLKTEKRMYVSGVNCQIPHAKEQFMETKRRFGKMDGRTCYHGYQSFRAGEVDADTAHRIGVELAKELWGDQFEVVVATHLNTDHYHNHFVINSVSSVDGRKFSNRKPDYARMREVSDRLCKEHQLSVIKNPKGKGKSYSQWSAEKNGKPTYPSLVKADIDRAILASTTMRDFQRVMEQMGYTFKWFKKNGQQLEHQVAIPPGAKKGVRLDRLGEEYTIEQLEASCVASANAEDYEILVHYLCGVDVDLFALHVEADHVLNLGEECALCALYGLENVQTELLIGIPNAEVDLTCVFNGSDHGLLCGNLCQKAVQCTQCDFFHYCAPPRS